ncbi:MAG TPA: amidohydrolase [Bacteroidales bacterium]|nr:amidohydrolase [Bacteroidales bacterium]
MDQIKKKIRALSRENLQQFINWRRHLHAHPELSMQEYETAAFVSARLTEMNIPHQTGVAQTGIVAMIYGRNPKKKTIALRADMDALAIEETNDVPYKSQNPGVMHACGHDVHTASLLGVAHILSTLKDDFEGTVKLFFQPSEERYPGGAIQMIRAGAMENPRPANVFGQHVYPELEAGMIGIRAGDYMASTDEIHLTITGKGGHGAQPSLHVDTVLIASHIVVALQQIVSRQASPDMPTVLSFGRFIANGQTNVIPDQVKIAGTMRTFDEAWRQEAHRRITAIAQSIAQGMRGSCEVFIDPGYPFVYNDPEVATNVKKWAEELLGADKVIDLPLRMTGEDFSYFANEVPSCFYRLGVANKERGITSSLHSSTFDVDEKSLETSTALMAWIAINALAK